MGLLRLFLATTVAMAHLQSTVLQREGLRVWDGYYMGFNAGYSVMAFYMISGFLISMVLASKYKADPCEFYFKRGVRIFSLYLPMVALSFILLDETVMEFIKASPIQKLANFSLLGNDWVIWLDPENERSWLGLPHPLHQAWTLSAEFTFYLAAPWLLRSNVASAIALIASAGVRFAMVHKFGWSDKWLYFFLPSTFLFFLMGHWARLLALEFASLRNPFVALGLIAICFINLGIRLAPWDTKSFWLAMICLALSLPGLFRLSKDVMILNWLGGLSYPIYLTHNLTRMVAVQNWHVERLFPPLHIAPATAIMLPYLLCVFVTAVAAHYLLERPCALFLDASRSAAAEIFHRKARRVDTADLIVNDRSVSALGTAASEN
jgi:peptidoglycan/LPS O-acetylase OafA/YrhL